MKKLIIAFLMVAALAVGVYAVDINGTLTHTWTPQAGDAIRSADVRTDHAEEEAYANTSADSTVDWNNMSASSVNATHLAPGAVHAVHIDSGAIMFDTQIAFNAISAAKLVSTTDTTDNFSKTIYGFYWGDGTDSRQIWNTYQTGTSGTGETIPFTILRAEVHCFTNNDSGNCFVTDAFDDTGIFTMSGSTRLLPIGGQGLWGGYADGSGHSNPAFGTNGDTNYFIVNYLAGGYANQPTAVNDPGEAYYFEVTGY